MFSLWKYSIKSSSHLQASYAWDKTAPVCSCRKSAWNHWLLWIPQTLPSLLGNMRFQISDYEISDEPLCPPNFLVSNSRRIIRGKPRGLMIPSSFGIQLVQRSTPHRKCSTPEMIKKNGPPVSLQAPKSCGSPKGKPGRSRPGRDGDEIHRDFAMKAMRSSSGKMVDEWDVKPIVHLAHLVHLEGLISSQMLGIQTNYGLHHHFV